MGAKQALTRSRWKKAEAALAGQKWAEAEQHLASICAVDRGDGQAWLARSEVVFRLGRFEDAVRCAEEAERLWPGRAEVALAEGKAWQMAGAPERAERCYRTAISRAPLRAESHYLLANVLRECKRVEEAASEYGRALELRPDFVEAMANLGALWLAWGRREEALSLLSRANELLPDAPPVLCSLGTLFEQNRQFEDALAWFERALVVAPGFPDAVKGAAMALERLGRVVEARALLAPALARHPGHPGLALVAARLARNAGELQEALGRIAHVALPEQTPEILMLKGQVLDRLGRVDAAMASWSDGQRLLASQVGNRADEREPYLERILRLRRYTEPLCGIASADTAAPKPVFLLGFPRSGTTLLEQALDSHPALQSLEEKGTSAALVAAFETVTGGDPQRGASLSEADLGRLREIYWREVARHLDVQPGRRLVDKMPLNSVNAAILWRVFPEAQFILALRHPCDAVLSCYMQGMQLHGGPGDFFSLEGWAKIYEAALGNWLAAESTLPMRAVRVRYEDLVTDFAGVMRPLIEFLGLEWDEAVLDPAGHARSRAVIGTPSYHQVTQPIYTSARYRWEKYRAHFERAMPHLRAAVQAFGYAD